MAVKETPVNHLSYQGTVERCILDCERLLRDLDSIPLVVNWGDTADAYRIVCAKVDVARAHNRLSAMLPKEL